MEQTKGGAGVGCLVVAALLLAGPALIAWQCYGWIRYGVWIPWSPLTLLLWMGAKAAWIFAPEDWIGLHRLIDAIPLSLVLLGIGMFALWLNGPARR
jgi:hypothetical protein